MPRCAIDAAYAAARARCCAADERRATRWRVCRGIYAAATQRTRSRDAAPVRVRLRRHAVTIFAMIRYHMILMPPLTTSYCRYADIFAFAIIDAVIDYFERCHDNTGSVAYYFDSDMLLLLRRI